MKIKHILTALLVIISFSSFSIIPDDQGSGNSQQQKPKAPLAQRIGHYDKSKAFAGKNVHDGTGTLYMQTLLNRDAVTNLNFMHKGPLMPKSSIGHHFHFDSDEMFLILDGDCEFTVNGHTAALAAPVGVPCPSRNSHAVYNPSADKAADWVNFNVRVTAPAGTAPGAGPGGFGQRGSFNYSADPTGTFNLGDDRASVKLEKPTFIHTGHLTKDQMRAVANMTGGKDTVFYRRALGPSAFVSNWAFVDHLLIPSKASVGKHFHAGVDEVYLVIKGKGVVTVNDETAEVAYGDAIPIRAGEIHSFENNSNEPFEMIIYGIALEKGKLDITAVK
jgi:mannose-6-phosphate isomerase-like protein (cupin superfamily)